MLSDQVPGVGVGNGPYIYNVILKVHRVILSVNKDKNQTYSVDHLCLYIEFTIMHSYNTYYR